MKNTILNEIIQNKIEWIRYNKLHQPLNKLESLVVTSNRNFYSSLQSPDSCFLLECKKATPSQGIIRKNFDIKEIVQVYVNYASVISVVTEEKYFYGNLNLLHTASNHSNQPILCKDFIIDPYQVWLARYYKADAILLILSILNDQQYQQLVYLANELKMGILTEINNATELQRAINLGAQVIGINNRNLSDFSIDFNRTKKLAAQISKDIIIISESGINNYADICQLRSFVNGFLIGSTLMAQPNLEIAIRKLLFGENKICGLTRQEDAKISYQTGAIYGGLIFIDKSLRYINKNQACLIIKSAPLKFVGVFANHPISDIVQLVILLKLAVVQLHGNEDQYYINKLRDALPKNTKIWKAISISHNIPNYNLLGVDRYLFDNGHGGTGKCFDWSLLKYNNLNNVMLAGNLNINNCKQAAQLGCSGLDFNSGVEIQPGIKDAKKIIAVFNILKHCSFIIPN